MPETGNQSCRGSHTTAADADIVLNTAADPARAASWLPGLGAAQPGRPGSG